MKTKIPKSERPGCLGQMMSFNKSNTEWKDFNKMQKAFGKNYLGLLLLIILVTLVIMFLTSGTIQAQTTIPDGWYNSEVNIRDMAENIDTTLSLYVNVGDGEIKAIKIDEFNNLCRTSDEYKWVGGNLNCVFSRGSLLKATSNVYIWYAEKTVIFKILIK